MFTFTSLSHNKTSWTNIPNSIFFVTWVIFTIKQISFTITALALENFLHRLRCGTFCSWSLSTFDPNSLQNYISACSGEFPIVPYIDNQPLWCNLMCFPKILISTVIFWFLEREHMRNNYLYSPTTRLFMLQTLLYRRADLILTSSVPLKKKYYSRSFTSIIHLFCLYTVTRLFSSVSSSSLWSARANLQIAQASTVGYCLSPLSHRNSWYSSSTHKTLIQFITCNCAKHNVISHYKWAFVFRLEVLPHLQENSSIWVEHC